MAAVEGIALAIRRVEGGGKDRQSATSHSDVLQISHARARCAIFFTFKFPINASIIPESNPRLCLRGGWFSFYNFITFDRMQKRDDEMGIFERWS